MKFITFVFHCSISIYSLVGVCLNDKDRFLYAALLGFYSWLVWWDAFGKVNYLNDLEDGKD